MIRSAILSFYRSLLRHPLYAALNLLGLAFGIAVFILLSLFVRYETGYDRWLPDAERIYAVTYNTHARQAAHQPPRYVSARYVIDAVHDDFPDVIGTRLQGNYVNVRTGRRVYPEEIQLVDPNFFRIFDIPAIAGDRDAALRTPDGVILSERAARKYFERTDVVGETLYLREDGSTSMPVDARTVPEQAWRVLAVLSDAPANATVRFDIVRLYRPADRDPYWFAWGSQMHVRTYFKLDAQQHARLAAGLAAAIKAHSPYSPDTQAYFDRFFGDTEIRLLPFASEHLADIRVRQAVAAVETAGLLAFAVSLINSVNLATARAGLRAREVAIRKTAGATRMTLIVQFLSEALLLGVAALVIAFSLVELFLPIVNGLGHLALKLDYGEQLPTLAALACAVLAASALAGLYPAFVLSSFKSMRGWAVASMAGRHGRIVREALAVVQFATASAFFIIIAGFAAQIRHLETEPLGFSRDGLFLTDSLITRMMPVDRGLAIQAAWRRIPGVIAVASGPVPGRFFGAPHWPAHRQGQHGNVDTQMVWMSGDFFPAYRTKLLAGRALSAEDDLQRQGIDPVATVMDEAAITASTNIDVSAVRALGFASPAGAINQTVMIGSSAFHIVGVVADQHFAPPTQAKLPTLYVYSSHSVNESLGLIAYDGVDEATARRRIEAVWQASAAEVPFALTTAREALDYYYADDRRNTRLFTVGGVVAGLIGAIGLFGMAAFNTSARLQEIAVRKSFGASRRRVARLLILQLLRPVLIANVAAWPIGFVVLDGWLNTFADRVAMSPLFFMAGSALSLLIAVATVAGIAISAARTPPGEALRQI